MHSNLWYKLIKLGLRGNILNIVKNMYSNVKSRVRTGMDISDEFICSTGVRQGESLSPFQFSPYVNDLEEHLSIHGFDGIDIEFFKNVSFALCR